MAKWVHRIESARGLPRHWAGAKGVGATTCSITTRLTPVFLKTAASDGARLTGEASYGATDRLRKDGPGSPGSDEGLEEYVHQAGLDRGLLELVKLRASLINGCAYCADMHTKVARSQGETEQRLDA